MLKCLTALAAVALVAAAPAQAEVTYGPTYGQDRDGHPPLLLGSNEEFPQRLGEAYLRYRQALLDSNHLDFAHQQKLVYDLLLDRDREVPRCQKAGHGVEAR